MIILVDMITILSVVYRMAQCFIFHSVQMVKVYLQIDTYIRLTILIQKRYIIS